ncbi:hypothetical protein L1987_36869 [Smallanthus sonchifolius]|uniref:Uncharacterized protein n=1 Tax=Smallanthus sonchifolius TaxID=185202 RepID=A0ACB9HGL1_9ASTR|nr:hypothetical protein L1987_36869 [Smallanthus sonchifolius]
MLELHRQSKKAIETIEGDMRDMLDVGGEADIQGGSGGGSVVGVVDGTGGDNWVAVEIGVILIKRVSGVVVAGVVFVLEESDGGWWSSSVRFGSKKPHHLFVNSYQIRKQIKIETFGEVKSRIVSKGRMNGDYGVIDMVKVTII